MPMVPGASRPARFCRACNACYTPTGNCQVFCPECAELRRLYKSRLSQLRYQLKRGTKVGVGSGGLNAGGPTEHNYREFFLDDVYNTQGGHCLICYKGVSKSAMLLHHKDHDRRHNVRSNFEGVCKACHQIEHECWLAFSKVQRLSREGVPASAGKRTALGNR